MNKFLKRIIPQKKNNKRIMKVSKQLSRKFATCGNNLLVFGEVKTLYPDRIHIGNDCRINDMVYLNARSGIVIGNNVTLSFGCKLISTGYSLEEFFENGKRKHIENSDIFINDNCWICADAIILPGIHITGKNVVVAAGSVVTKNIEDSNVIVAGNPAKIIKNINPDRKI